MSALTDTLKTIAESLSQAIDPETGDPYVFTYHFCEQQEMNNTADKFTISQPFVLHDSDSTSELYDGVNQTNERHFLKFIFAVKSKKGEKMVTRQPRIDQMKVACIEFYNKVKALDTAYFEIIGRAPSYPINEWFDLNADGYALTLTLDQKDVDTCPS